ncbi:MAG: TolC family protein, partial [Gemmataceae bacterium]|nr:TolC family protein [Gemmataceae bacterium]
SSISTINFDFVQPFLRGGSRAVTLEPLTAAERNLVYEIRSYARFRKEYFQYITAGVDMANFRGTVVAFGRAFAPGSVTLNSGNPIRREQNPGVSGRVDLTVESAAPSSGYLPTLQNQGLLEIDRQNINRLERIVRLFEAYEEGGEVSSLQVGLAQSQLLDARSQYLQDDKNFRDSLDQLKLQLGVPPPVPIQLDDAVLQPILRQFERYERLIADYEDAVKRLEGFDALAEAGKLRDQLRKLFTEAALVKETEQFRKSILPRWQQWDKEKLADKALADKLSKLYTVKQELLDLKTNREKEDKTLTPEEAQKLTATLSEISLGELERTLRVFERAPWAKAPNPREQRELHSQLFRQVRSLAVDILGEAANERNALLRPQWPKLPPIVVEGVDLVNDDLETAYAVGTRTALEKRLDLMNARAELVDAWRQIAIYANSLLGYFNVGYHMDSSTPDSRAAPFAFNPTRTRHQLYLNTELPLVRLAERNNYRAALIAYQRARRTLMAAEDQVAAQVRADLRQVQLLARNYPIQQLSVELAFQNVESSLETFRAPQPPGAAGNAASVAALTQQLLAQYQRLPGQQRALLNTWIQYQIARQQLYLDLELLPLDSRGVWIDELTSGPPSRTEPSVSR